MDSRGRCWKSSNHLLDPARVRSLQARPQASLAKDPWKPRFRRESREEVLRVLALPQSLATPRTGDTAEIEIALTRSDQNVRVEEKQHH